MPVEQNPEPEGTAMKKLSIEMIVGLFLLAALLSFSYLAIRMGDLEMFRDPGYGVSARFVSISGLKEGALVELAGVKIGKVTDIELDRGEYEAVVQMSIDQGVNLQDDSIASIRTAGIIGDRFVNITPGGSDDFLGPGDEIEETESAISLEELVSKYIFESE